MFEGVEGKKKTDHVLNSERGIYTHISYIPEMNM